MKAPSAIRVATRNAAAQRVYRGMVVDMPSAKLASAIRKSVVAHAQRKGSPFSEGEIMRFIVAAIKMNDIGESWSSSRRSAEKFGRGDYALDRKPTSRGKTLGILLSGEVQEGSGYDPVDSGEEVWQMTLGENEVRLPQGTQVKITGVDVYVPKFQKDPYTGFTNETGKWYYLHSGGQVFSAKVAAHPSAMRVATLYREARITFRDEPSPRVDYARRFSLCDSKAEPPAKREYLFTDKYRHHNLKTYKRLKKPVLESRGVTDPCDIAYIDYAGGGGSVQLHLVITRSDHRGKGLATKLLKEFYKQKVSKGAAVRWGRIMNPTSMALFEKMKKARPDVVHMGGKFY